MNIKDVWFSKEYDKIRNNEFVKNNLMFCTFGGSHAYGTNVETSDVDVRGITLNNISSLIGIHPFEQVVDNETDTTIYSFNKIITLLSNCNPNTIELLGCKEDSYYFPDNFAGELGKELIKNKQLFLSKRAVYSFGGYATQQLRRLQNAIAHDSYTQTIRDNHISKTLESCIHHFNESYTSFDTNSMKFSRNNDELVIDVSFKKYPIRDFTGIMNEITNIVREYDKLNGRNKKKDEIHLNKHAMHLVRLYLMCFDILEKGEIITYREEDKEMLLDIRNGKYMNDDGTYKSEYFDIINEYDNKLNRLKETTFLPDKPDMTKIEQFCKKVNYITLKHLYK